MYSSTPTVHVRSLLILMGVTQWRPCAAHTQRRVYKILRPLIVIEHFIKLHIWSWHLYVRASVLRRESSVRMGTLHHIHRHIAEELGFSIVQASACSAWRHTSRCKHCGMWFDVDARSMVWNGAHNRGMHVAIESLRVFVFKCSHWLVWICQRIRRRKHHG